MKRNCISNLKLAAAATCMLLACNAARAESNVSDIKLTDLRAGGIYVTNSNGNSGSGIVSWNPSYVIDESWSVGANVGVSSIKGKANKSLLLTDFGISAGYKIDPTWSVELGAGSQTWTDVAAASTITLNGLYSFGAAPLFGYFDRAYAGFTSVDQKAATTEVQIGLTMSFGSEAKGGANVTQK